MKPEHIVKLAFIGGITVIVSLAIIFSFLAGVLPATPWIIAGFVLLILIGYVMYVMF